MPETERERVIDEARRLPLLDGVFSVLFYNRHRRGLGRPPHALPIVLAEVFPAATETDLAEVSDRVTSLLSSAYRFGDALLAHNFTNYEATKETLAAEHPGFSAKSYEETINYGCFQAR